MNKKNWEPTSFLILQLICRNSLRQIKIFLTLNELDFKSFYVILFCFSFQQLRRNYQQNMRFFTHFLVFQQPIRLTWASKMTNGLLECVGCHFRPKNTKDDASVATLNIETSRAWIRRDENLDMCTRVLAAIEGLIDR